MFGIGMPEFILIMVVALVVIGPKKLPDIARALGKAMGEFKKAAREFKDTMNVNEDVKEIKEIKRSVADAWKDATRVEDGPDAAPADRPPAGAETVDPPQSGAPAQESGPGKTPEAKEEPGEGR